MSDDRFKRTKGVAKVLITAARAKLSPNQQSKQRAQQALATWMADARGLPTKVGQFLAGNSQESVFQPLLETLTL